MNRVFILITNADPLVMKEMAFMYGLNSLKHKWMDQVRIIFWGPSQNTVISDATIKPYLTDLESVGVELWACKGCSDNLGVTDKLKALGIRVEYVGVLLSDMLKEGWHQLTL